jgi:O-methyltransferase
MRNLREIAKDVAGRNRFIVARYDAKHRRAWMDEVTAVRRERELLLNHGEACQLISAVTATAKRGGDMAEVGVAFGASAKLIAEHDRQRTLHLFDTFDGLPGLTTKDSRKFAAGQFRSNVDSVRQYLDGLNVRFHQGFFPLTGAAVNDRTFSFVHLDADLYDTTRAALEFFYPRMCPGAILLGHDYVTSEGVNAAFNEFFANRPEPVVELTGYQCMVVKVGE